MNDWPKNTSYIPLKEAMKDADILPHDSGEYDYQRYTDKSLEEVQKETEEWERMLAEEAELDNIIF